MIKAEGPDTVGALIVEPMVAGGGIIVPVPEYYPIIQEICKKYGVYLIMDEVVCGVSFHGKWSPFWPGIFRMVVFKSLTRVRQPQINKVI